MLFRSKFIGGTQIFSSSLGQHIYGTDSQIIIIIIIIIIATTIIRTARKIIIIITVDNKG